MKNKDKIYIAQNPDGRIALFAHPNGCMYIWVSKSLKRIQSICNAYKLMNDHEKEYNPTLIYKHTLIEYIEKMHDVRLSTGTIPRKCVGYVHLRRLEAIVLGPSIKSTPLIGTRSTPITLLDIN